MDAKKIIEIGRDLYDFKRQRKSAVSDGEQLLFDACWAMQQLQAELNRIKMKVIKSRLYIIRRDLKGSIFYFD